MTIASQILKIVEAQPELTSKPVADLVGCKPSYVRVVRHRNGIFKGPHNPEIDYQKRKTVKLSLEEYRKLCKKANIEPKY